MRSKITSCYLALTLFLFSFLPHCQKGNSSSSTHSTPTSISSQKASVIITPSSTSSPQTNTTNAAAIAAVAAVDAGTEILPPQPLVTTPPAIPPSTTPLTILSLSPDSGSVASLPIKLTMTTSADIQVPSETSISVTGTCAILPTISAVPQPNTGSAWDLFLSGMNCQEGKTIVIQLSPTELLSLADSQPGTGDPLIRTFVLQTTGPSFTWGAPSPASYIASTKNVQIPFTYTNAAQVVSVMPQPTTSLYSIGTVTCQVALQNLSVSGGTISLTCTGTGTGSIDIQVKGGLVTDAIGNPSSASSVVKVTVDTMPPSVLSMLPADGQVNPVPNTVIVSLNKPVKSPLASTVFSISGCNASLTGSAVGQDGKTLTTTVSAPACSNGDIVAVTIDPSKLVDLSGNVGTAQPQSTNYTLQTEKPTTSLTSPTTTTRLGSASSLSIPVTFSSTLPLTAAAVLPPSLYLVPSTGTAMCNPSLGAVVSQGTTATAVLSLSGCQGNGPFTIGLAGGILQDSLSNLSAPSNLLPFTIDTTPPTVTLTPISSSHISQMYSAITATFSEPVQSPLSNNLFSASSTTSACKPALGSPSLSNDALTATLSLSSTGCQNGDTVLISADPNQLVDTIGNQSTTNAIVRTSYTLAAVGPVVTLSGPSFSPSNTAQTLNATNTATFTVTYTNASPISDAASTNPYAMVPTTGVTCKLTPGTTTGLGSNTVTSTFTLSACKGTGSISLTVNAGNMKDAIGTPSSSSSTTQPYPVDTNLPTLSSVDMPSSTQGINLTKFTPALSFTVSFSKPIQYSSTIFTLTSIASTTPPIAIACATKPTLTSTSISTTQIGLAISGGSCAQGSNVTLNVTPTNIIDTVGNVASGATAPFMAFTIDLTPVVGVAPTVTSSAPLTWSVSLTQAYSQTATTDANLLYKIIAYTSNLPNTPTNSTSTNTTATPPADWAVASALKYTNPPSLVSSSGVSLPYYFAVLVKDPLTGLIGYYPTAAAAPVNKYAYYVPATTGNLAGISGADTLCKNNRLPTFGPTNTTVKALLVDGSARVAPSTSGSPTDWPLTANTTYYYPTNATMGTTNSTSLFPNLPAYTPPTPTTASVNIWTGLSVTSGAWTTSSNTCSKWLSNNSSVSGTYSTMSPANSTSAFSINTTSCATSANFYILCVHQ